MAQPKSPLATSTARLLADVVRDYLDGALPAVQDRMRARQLIELLSGYQQLCRWAGSPKDATWAKGWQQELTLAIGVGSSVLPEAGHSNGSPNTYPPASPPSETGSKARRSRAAQPQEPNSTT